MSIRRSHRHGQQGSSFKARLARGRDKAMKLRERIKQATLSFAERRQRHLAWWQQAFRTPLTAGHWLFSRVRCLWVALLSLIGVRPQTAAARLRTYQTRRFDSRSHRTGLFRLAMHESLEARQLMAADFYVGPASAFVVTQDNGDSVLSTGDTVTWLGLDGVAGGTGGDADVTGR
ncbi:MAG: hypothetical protein ACTHOU_10595, partial [Aureliella sp.]